MSRRRLMVGAASAGALIVLAISANYLRPAAESRSKEFAQLPQEEAPVAAVPGPMGENSVADGAGTCEEALVVSPRPPVPSQLAGVFDESRGTIARMKAVDALGCDLSPEALSALQWLLRNPDEGEALRNNVANRLRKCGEEHLVSDLTEMLWDEKETPKWRNYCAQHLYTCYDKKPDPTILDTLLKAADADEKLVRICAVWSLARAATPRNAGKLPDEETLHKIRSAALSALREKDAHFLIRTAGVQSCARLGLKEALPDIREIAGDDNTKPTHLRVVAVAALGDLGDDVDVPLLERLSASAKGQVKSAAAHALKKVRARIAVPAEPPF